VTSGGRLRWIAVAAAAILAVIGATMVAQDQPAGGRGGRGAAPPNPVMFRFSAEPDDHAARS
jgi:hypothetical protein